MKHNGPRLVIPLLLWLCNISCSVSTSDEIVIPLPGKINGQPLILAETAASNISINQDVVPPLITRVWWTTNMIATENYPTSPRNKFPGDSYRIPDKSRSVWYLIDLQNGSVHDYDGYGELTNRIKELGGNLEEFRLMPLREAQLKREDELGLKFSAANVNALLSGNKSTNRAFEGR